jgi:transposase
MSIGLSDDQFYELIKTYKTHPKSYVRRRALALVHLNEGLSLRQVAKILKVRHNAVLEWKKRFLRLGFTGLQMEKRNKRKPKMEKERLLDIVKQRPQNFGVESSRWTLELLGKTFPELDEYSISGIWRLLKRSGVSWQKGRYQLISPDPDYEEKKT